VFPVGFPSESKVIHNILHTISGQILPDAHDHSPKLTLRELIVPIDQYNLEWNSITMQPEYIQPRICVLRMPDPFFDPNHAHPPILIIVAKFSEYKKKKFIQIHKSSFKISDHQIDTISPIKIPIIRATNPSKSAQIILVARNHKYRIADPICLQNFEIRIENWQRANQDFFGELQNIKISVERRVYLFVNISA
jgi:hypothetical protein